MGTAAEKYRIYLSGYEMQVLLDLTDPANLDESEVNEPLKSARVVLKKKMAEVDEGTATVDLKVKGKQPGKYSAAGLGFDDVNVVKNKQLVKETDEQAIAALEANFAKFEAASAEATRIVESGGKLPLLDNLLLDPAFKFGEDN